MTDLADDYRALTSAAGSWLAHDYAQFEIAGSDAHALINRIVTADLSLLDPGHCVPSLLLREDATILDRVTVYRFPERVMLLVNPAQRAEAWDHLVARKRGNVRLRDISDAMAAVMVRGPGTATLLAALLTRMPHGAGDVASSRLDGIDVFAARTPADGADGIDFYCRSRDVEALRSALERAGVRPVGDDAWHLTQLEWGIARVGVDIDPDDTPVEAGLEQLVAEGKGAPFPGETAFAARRRTGAIKTLVGFHVMGEELPPVGARASVAGVMVDRVRAAGWSPRVGVIGTVAVPTSSDAPGTTLSLMSGDHVWQARVVRRPFVSRALA
jgi:aminomethyltransferase